MKSLFFGFGVAAIFVSGAYAQPELISQEPKHSLECVFMLPETDELMSRVTLFLFEEPMAIDRFSSVTGHERVDGVTAIAEVFKPDGEIMLYDFGTYNSSEMAFDVSFFFATTKRGDGITFTRSPGGDPYIVDRMAGTMRPVIDNPNAPIYDCAKLDRPFRDTAATYHQLIVDAVEQFDGTRKF